MDEATLNAYERDAAGFAKEWNEQPSPLDMYDLLSRYFHPGPTADIGCGSGRDLAWLVSNGYDACGFDASPALVRQARSVYDELDVREALTPEHVLWRRIHSSNQGRRRADARGDYARVLKSALDRRRQAAAEAPPEGR